MQVPYPFLQFSITFTMFFNRYGGAEIATTKEDMTMLE